MTLPSTPFLLLALLSAAALADGMREPLSGLPMPSGFSETTGRTQTFRFCGKSARSVSYIGGNFSDVWEENAWFRQALPGARLFVTAEGLRTYVSADGSRAVQTDDAVIFYYRFSPGLSPAEMGILGATRAARSCLKPPSGFARRVA